MVQQTNDTMNRIGDSHGASFASGAQAPVPDWVFQNGVTFEASGADLKIVAADGRVAIIENYFADGADGTALADLVSPDGSFLSAEEIQAAVAAEGVQVAQAGPGGDGAATGGAPGIVLGADTLNALMDALASQQNPEAALQQTIDQAVAEAVANGADPNAARAAAGDFANTLFDSLQNGVPPELALQNASTVFSAQISAFSATQNGPTGQGPAGNPALQALASGQGVDQVVGQLAAQNGGQPLDAATSQALAGALADALAQGLTPEQALAQAAQQTGLDAAQLAQGPVDPVLAALASGQNGDGALNGLDGGNAAFQQALEQALANGQSPQQAVLQAQNAMAQLQASQQQVATGVGDPLLAALASGQGVDGLPAGDAAFQQAMEQALASGASPEQAMAQATAAQAQVLAAQQQAQVGGGDAMLAALASGDLAALPPGADSQAFQAALAAALDSGAGLTTAVGTAVTAATQVQTATEAVSTGTGTTTLMTLATGDGAGDLPSTSTFTETLGNALDSGASPDQAMQQAQELSQTFNDIQVTDGGIPGGTGTGTVTGGLTTEIGLGPTGIGTPDVGPVDFVPQPDPGPGPGPDGGGGIAISDGGDGGGEDTGGGTTDIITTPIPIPIPQPLPYVPPQPLPVYVATTTYVPPPPPPPPTVTYVPPPPPPTPVDNAPTGGTINANATEDVALTFTQAQFSAAFSDPEGAALSSVRIDILPTFGTLTLGGNAVNPGQEINAASLGSLVYTPTLNYYGNDNFGYSASDGANYSTQSSVAIQVAAVNDAPVVTANANGNGGSLALDGVDDHVTLTPILGLSGGITMEAWVNLSAAPTWGRIIELGNGAGSDNVFLSFDGATGNIAMGSYNGGVGSHMVTTSALPLNQWVHIAAVNNGNGTGAIYFNGVAQTVTYPQTSLTAVTNVVRSTNYIGKSPWGFDGYLQGEVADVRVWNVARGGDLIEDGMNKQLVGNEASLVSNWKLNDGVGTTAVDATGVATGTVVGQTPGLEAWSPIGPTPSTFVMNEDGGTLSGAVFGTDVDSFTLAYSVTGAAANGTANVNAVTGEWTYTPNANYFGADSFTVTVDDGAGGTTTQVVSVDVKSVNDSPVIAVNTGLTVLEGSSVPVSTAMLQMTDVESATTAMTYRVDSSPTHGTLFKNGVAAGVNSTFTQADIDNGVVSYIHDGSETTADSFNFSYTDGVAGWQAGSVAIAVTPVAEAPQSYSNASAMYFDGTNDYVTIANSINALTGSTYTFEAWVRPENLNGVYQNIMGNYEGAGFSLAIDAAGKFVFEVNSSGSGVQSIVSDAAATEGHWYHVAGVWDGAATKLYVDGMQQVDTAVATGTLTLPNKAVMIGAQPGGAGAASLFTGVIDEARIWTDARSEAEINGFMEPGAVNPHAETNLWGLWQLDEGTGASTAEKSGTNRTGMVAGGKAWTDSGVPAGGLEIAAPTGAKNAMTFNGANTHVDLGGAAGILTGAGDFTYETWVNSSASGTEQMILSLGNWTASGGGVYLSLAATGEASVSGGYGNGYITSANAINDGHWHHVAAVNSGGTVSLYVDGQLESSATWSPAPNITNNGGALNSFIGQYSGGDRQFNGNIADVRAWSTARTQAQIQDNMHKQLTGGEATLTGYWKLDEGTGTMAHNSAASAVVTSFSAGTESWALSNGLFALPSGAAEGATPNHIAVGSVDGEGAISMTDNLTGNTRAELTYFSAPASFHGDQSAMSGGTLSYDIKATGGTGWIGMNSFASVRLTDGTTELVAARTYDPTATDTWTSYSFNLDTSTAWKVGTLGGATATQAQINTVLSNVTDLLIQGEYRLGSGDVGYLSNVELTPGGTINNGAWQAPTIDGSDYALNLDGVNDYASVSDVSLSGAFTIEAWVKADTAATWSRIVDFGNGAGSDNIVLGFSGASGEIALHTYSGSNQTGIATVGTTLPLGEWVHVAAVNDGTGGASIYFNGVAQTTQFVWGTSMNAANAVARNSNFIGKSNWGADSLFDGQMNEVRVWNKALTQAEIQSGMTRQANGTEADLAGVWHFNEGFGTTAVNAVTAANDTVAGGATYANMNDVALASSEAYKGMVLGSDADGGTLTYTFDGQTHNGNTITASGNTYTLTNDAQADTDSFDVVVTDDTGNTTTHTVHIGVA